GLTSLVVGAARSGVALALHLTAEGQKVRVVDRKPAADLQSTISQMPSGVDLQLGGYDARVLDGIDTVYASPGVPWDSDLLNDARAKGIPLSSHIGLFLKLCKGSGVVLNMPPDHRARHRTLERYVDLKARAIEDADYAALNGRDEIVRGLAPRTRGQVVWFDQHQPLPPMPLPGRHNMENALAAAAV